MNGQGTQQAAAGGLEHGRDFLNVQPHATPFFGHGRRPQPGGFGPRTQALQPVNAQGFAGTKQFTFYWNDFFVNKLSDAPRNRLYMTGYCKVHRGIPFSQSLFSFEYNMVGQAAFKAISPNRWQ